MAATEANRFDLNLRHQLSESSRITRPVYDRVKQTFRYALVLYNAELAELRRTEASVRECQGLARSRHVLALDADRSAVIFGEDRDHLLTLVKRYGRRLPESMVKNYIAQLCSICLNLHERGYVLQGALQLNQFALDDTDHIFLLSTVSAQPASRWRPRKCNPQYLAPELLLPTSYSTNSTLCDMFAADAYSVGICGLILATARPPFSLPPYGEYTNAEWRHVKATSSPDIPDDLDDELRCCLSHLLDRSPESRMRLQDALHHPALHPYLPHTRPCTNTSNVTANSLSSGTLSQRRQQREMMPASPEGSETNDSACSFDSNFESPTRSPTPPLQGLDLFSGRVTLPAGHIQRQNNLQRNEDSL